MFRTRLISGIVLLIIIIGLGLIGGLTLWSSTLIISLIGMYELYTVFGLEKKSISYIGYLAAILYYIIVYIDIEAYITFVFIAILLVFMSIYMFTFPKFSIEDISIVFFSVFYVAILLSFIYRTRIMEHGIYLIWLIYISSWGSDMCAYAVGMLIGRHKIAPLLSPKKSIEGSLGGVIGSALMGMVFAYFFGKSMITIEHPIITCTISSAIGAVISQIGDFAASAIKRNHNIKDYGDLIPGHGGILDRFDSVLFTAPAVYFALLFLM